MIDLRVPITRRPRAGHQQEQRANDEATVFGAIVEPARGAEARSRSRRAETALGQEKFFP